jgi:hypothetical protein
MAKENKEKLRIEIIVSLSEINDIACYHLEEEQSKLRNQICRELRKIHSRLDKIMDKNKKK